MTVYIVKKENEWCIHQIPDDQQTAFLAEHGDRILFSSPCEQGTIIRYTDLLKWIEATKEESSH